MKVYGDKDTTLYNVYVPSSMRTAPDYAYNAWYYITSPPPPGN